MKKKIEFANLTSSLASWLLEKLKAAPLDVGNIDEDIKKYLGASFINPRR